MGFVGVDFGKSGTSRLATGAEEKRLRSDNLKVLSVLTQPRAKTFPTEAGKIENNPVRDAPDRESLSPPVEELQVLGSQFGRPPFSIRFFLLTGNVPQTPNASRPWPPHPVAKIDRETVLKPQSQARKDGVDRVALAFRPTVRGEFVQNVFQADHFG